MEIRAIIVDDESSARETLSELIHIYTSDVHIVAEASSVQSGCEAILAHKPDIVFLDINMSPGTGFDLLEKLPEISFDIIFTTIYDNYALKAIRMSALDYLLKPINPLELCEAIEKIKKREQHSYQKNLEVLSENQKEEALFNKIVLPSAKHLVVTSLQDIIRCEGIKSYTAFFLVDQQQIIVSKTLKKFEELLEGQGFLRTHQSHLINLHHVRKYHKGRGGEVEMTDNSILPVSKYRKKELLESLKKLM